MTAAAAPVVVDAAAMPVGLREAVFIEAVTEEDAAALAVPLDPSPATTVTAAGADPADDEEEDAAALAVPLVPSPATTVTAAAAPAPLEEALVEALLAPAVPLLPLPPA